MYILPLCITNSHSYIIKPQVFMGTFPVPKTHICRYFWDTVAYVRDVDFIIDEFTM